MPSKWTPELEMAMMFAVVKDRGGSKFDWDNIASMMPPGFTGKAAECVLSFILFSIYSLCVLSPQHLLSLLSILLSLPSFALDTRLIATRLSLYTSSLYNHSIGDMASRKDPVIWTTELEVAMLCALADKSFAKADWDRVASLLPAGFTARGVQCVSPTSSSFTASFLTQFRMLL